VDARARGLHLRLLELVEHRHPDRPGDETDDRQHDHDLQQGEALLRPAARANDCPTLSTHGDSSGWLSHWTNSCIIKMGCRMENTMKPTPTAMLTISAGDSRVVRRFTFPSTSRS